MMLVFGRVITRRNIDFGNESLEIGEGNEGRLHLISDVFKFYLLPLRWHADDSVKEVRSPATFQMRFECMSKLKMTKASFAPMFSSVMLIVIAHESGEIPDPCIVTLFTMFPLPVEQFD